MIYRDERKFVNHFKDLVGIHKHLSVNCTRYIADKYSVTHPSVNKRYELADAIYNIHNTAALSHLFFITVLIFSPSLPSSFSPNYFLFLCFPPFFPSSLSLLLSLFSFPLFLSLILSFYPFTPLSPLIPLRLRYGPLYKTCMRSLNQWPRSVTFMITKDFTISLLCTLWRCETENHLLND